MCNNYSILSCLPGISAATGKARYLTDLTDEMIDIAMANAVGRAFGQLTLIALELWWSDCESSSRRHRIWRPIDGMDVFTGWRLDRSR